MNERQGPHLPVSPFCQHASTEEYMAFVRGSSFSPYHQNDLLASQRRFVQTYPDLRTWFEASLAERVGRLHAEERWQASYPVSYQARSYLLFLGLRRYAVFDWEWLLAVKRLVVEPLLQRAGMETGFHALVEEAVNLGYKRSWVSEDFRWLLTRLFLATGLWHVNLLRAEHLDALAEAARRFPERSDVTLFFGTKPQCSQGLQNTLSGLYTLRLVLYHRGQLSTAPRMTHTRPARPVLNPHMEAFAARYLAVKRLTDRPNTVKKSDEALYRFIHWLSHTHPDVQSWAEVSRDHLLEFAGALRVMPGPRIERPLTVSSQRVLLSRLAIFFADTAHWQWEDGPSRPFLQPRDFPKLPERIPKYIPEEELAALMPYIRLLDCPYQRTALLVSRWSGARRGEIRRLSLDCLDRYPDGTSRLHIPTGKTYKERLIPLNDEAADAIRHLQAERKGKGERGFLDEQTGRITRYLFGSKASCFLKHISLNLLFSVFVKQPVW
jgi:integrase